MPLNPRAVRICSWPANPKEITLEHVTRLCETGDVAGVLKDMVRLTQQVAKDATAEKVSA